MHTFYVSALQAGQCSLSPEESYHCSKVLRLQEGERVLLIDGCGARAEGVIGVSTPKGVSLRVDGVAVQERMLPERTWVAVAPPKSSERVDWMVEKAVEIGVGRLTLLQVGRSVRRVANVERLQRIAISAAKQSARAWVPRIEVGVPFSQVLQQPTAGLVRAIAHLGEGVTQPLRGLLKGRNEPLQLLVGPEGGFAPSEVEEAVACGYSPVSLGEGRLRVETAVLVGCVFARVR